MRAARWIRRTHLLRPDEYICSACGACFGAPEKRCPACGHRMEKTRYDPSWADEAEELSALLDEDW